MEKVRYYSLHCSQFPECRGQGEGQPICLHREDCAWHEHRASHQLMRLCCLLTRLTRMTCWRKDGRRFAKLLVMGNQMACSFAKVAACLSCAYRMAYSARCNNLKRMKNKRRAVDMSRKKKWPGRYSPGSDACWRRKLNRNGMYQIGPSLRGQKRPDTFVVEGKEQNRQRCYRLLPYPSRCLKPQAWVCDRVVCSA